MTAKEISQMIDDTKMVKSVSPEEQEVDVQNSEKDKLKRKKALYYLKKYSNDTENDKSGTAAPDYKDYYWNVNPSKYYGL